MSREKEQLITDVMYLAMVINYKTDYCVMAYFSGHVDAIEISIRKSNKEYSKEVAKSEFYLDEDNYSLERLKGVKQQLIEILETNKVDTSSMDYEVEEIKHYYF